MYDNLFLISKERFEQKVMNQSFNLVNVTFGNVKVEVLKF